MSAKTLIIATRPAVARALATPFGIISDFGRHLECDSGISAFAISGPLLDFQKPEYYDSRYERWLLGDLPLKLPQKLEYKPAQNAAGKLDALSDLLKRTNLVIHAGNPDRDGQRHIDVILDYLGWKGPVKRYMPFDLAPASLEKFRKGIRDLPDNSEPFFRNLSMASQARYETDWLLGMNVCRAIGCRLNESGIRMPLSFSRLQTALIMLVSILGDIDSAKPLALFSGMEAVYEGGSDNNSFDYVSSLVLGKKGVLKEIRTICEKPYNLGELVASAAERFQNSFLDTMNAACGLYDMGLISYPVTSSNAYRPENISAFRELFEEKDILPPDDAVSGNETGAIAIVAANSKKLTIKSSKIYQIVSDNYENQFCRNDSRVKSEGLFVFDGPPRTMWKSSGAADIRQGEQVICDTVTMSDPEKLTSLALLRAALDVSLLEKTGEKISGIDKGCCFSQIHHLLNSMAKLEANDYARIVRNEIQVTDKARRLVSLLPKRLSTPTLSIVLEACFDKIAKGTLSLDGYRSFSRTILKP